MVLNTTETDACVQECCESESGCFSSSNVETNYPETRTVEERDIFTDARVGITLDKVFPQKTWSYRDELSSVTKKLCRQFNRDWMGRSLRLDPEYFMNYWDQETHAFFTTEKKDPEKFEFILWKAAYYASHLTDRHPDFGFLAGRFVSELIVRSAPRTFRESTLALQREGRLEPRYSEAALKWASVLEQFIVDDNNYLFDYIGSLVLFRQYVKSKDFEGSQVNPAVDVYPEPLENPQHTFMRISVNTYKEELLSPDPQVVNEALSKIHKHYTKQSYLDLTHATPTISNSGLKQGQLSSCFIVTLNFENPEKTLQDCKRIIENCGGIGLDLCNIMAKDLVPFCQKLEKYITPSYGTKTRQGAVSVTLPPSHAGFLDFLHLKHKGDETKKARGLFYQVWGSDLFRQTAENEGKWYLFDGPQCARLENFWGEDYVREYQKAVDEGLYVEVVDADALYQEILDLEILTGVPYYLNKDPINEHNNQAHYANPKSTNVCTEITQPSLPHEPAICNIATINLTNHFDPSDPQKMDIGRFIDSVCVATEALDKLIDVSVYPIPEAKTSNLKHRPLGLGLQGFANFLFLANVAYGTSASSAIIRHFAELLYFYALKTSNELAKKQGPYSTFKGSNLSKGILSFDTWKRSRDKKPQHIKDIFEKLEILDDEPVFTRHLDWQQLREDVMIYGARNSFLIAYPPTSNVSTITGNCETIDPLFKNLYRKSMQIGSFICLNPHLVYRLEDRGLWNNDTKRSIWENNGSIQKLATVDPETKKIFRQVTEINGKDVLKTRREVSPFVDQSMSMSFSMNNPEILKLGALHLWVSYLGLKSTIYYLRSINDVREAVFGIAPAISFISKFIEPTIISGLPQIPQTQILEDAKGKQLSCLFTKIISNILLKNAASKSSTLPQTIICTDEICTACAL
jgi:ribonucleoside-diphosphate reductase, alpha subunit